MSAVLWALGPQNSDIYLGLDLNPGGDWSWNAVRSSYLRALTSTDPSSRDTNFAKTFRGLGQLMHLVQDMSVPEHTRNDGHVAYAYEEWVRDSSSSNDAQRQAIWTNALANPLYYDLGALGQSSAFGAERVPITNLFDTNWYDGTNPQATLIQNIGLTEYTNANFFSSDTIFSPNYPNPAKANTNAQLVEIQAEDGVIDHARYVYINGQNYKLAAYTYFTENQLLSDQPEGWKYNLDDDVYKDYATQLIPRAVGYSAALLNYFFRGNIEISLPLSGVYAATEDLNIGFTRITLRAKNTTSSGDEMSDGTIELVVKYKLAHEDPFQSYPVETDAEFTYRVWPEASGVRSIPKDSPVELTFDLGSNPVRLWATDVYLQVIYHGRLGSENGAVAVGFKDISEPTPIDIFNNMDKVCINGNWYDAGSQAAIALVPPAWEVYAHDMMDEYIKISPADSARDASSDNYTFYIPLIPAGELYRAYILSDYGLNHSDYGLMKVTDTRDTSDHSQAFIRGTYAGGAIKRQVDYHVEDETECGMVGQAAPCDIFNYPLFYNFRGYALWGPGGVIIDNPKSPSDTSCSWEALR